MKAMILFPLVAALAVWCIGRRDGSRDPRLTTLALALLALLPGLMLLPKIPVLPVEVTTSRHENSGSNEWLHLLGGIWLTGCAVGWFRLARSAMGLARWRRESELVERIAGDVEIRVLQGLRGPVAAGVWRKMIFVPPCLEGLGRGYPAGGSAA
jgi:hypothetical protein